MENQSAFVAYQAAGLSANKAQKSAKQKKQNKSTNAKVHFKVPSPKKRKHTEVSSAQPAQSKSNGTASSPITNGNTTPQSKTKKKKKSDQQAHTSNVSNGTSVHLNEMASIATTSSTHDLNLSSVENGDKAFAHLLHGYGVKAFMANNWEKQPLYISREHNRGHYASLKVSTEAIDEMLRNNIVEYTKNLDVTSYENGVRETHNPDGRALPGSVWEFYRTGCSVRLLNPQTFIGPLHKFNATLQEYFHCLVGANIYLTPPNSQGFAPHYDDIEAFVLQIEGQKEWLLYPPRTEDEKLPRESSGNFQQDEIGEPKFREILSPGDMLYFPRGWIHQAKTVSNHHSLHITLSVYQKNAFADLFEELTKQALKTAIEKNVNFRKGLPVDIWNQFGETYSEFNDLSARRKQIKTHLITMFKEIQNYLDIDSAVDKLATKYQFDALPPVLGTMEKVRTCFGTKPLLNNNGDIVMPEMDEETEVRLLRAHIVRLTKVDGAYNLYYHVDNSKEYHGSDLNFVEVEEATTGVVKKLIHFYPKYVKIANLSNNIEESMAVVGSLWERGLIMTKNSLE
ncbi:bifunctional lysine-specific demethylase and histidyl-hydroxylase NO66 [Contarinia nasturtii]|uniref:bifunctional lysine-specific demethylase and histidyl-hydroxylase NO66 n=1 Tax=Contarinia nasturtii TaxID=265458 RepID=UPI0012D3F61A|nr:bifunctional lysine-specific demethylase and histidyl-hydroxylase NO66 [Contarinia nasturtii]